MRGGDVLVPTDEPLPELLQVLEHHWRQNGQLQRCWLCPRHSGRQHARLCALSY